MDITKAFTYVFDDKDWMMKVLIGALLSIAGFLIIPGFIIAGYSIQILRNVKKGVAEPLPEWAEWGEMLKDGFMVALAQIIYSLPIIIIACIAFGAAGGLASFENLDEDAIAAAMISTFGVVFCLILIFGIAMAFISPALQIQYVKHGDLASMFRFSEIIALIRENISDILLVVGVMIGTAFAFGIVSTVLGVIPCLGAIISIILSLAFSPYMAMVSGHLMGQLAQRVEGSAA